METIWTIGLGYFLCSFLLIVSMLTSGIVKGGPSYLASRKGLVDKILSHVDTGKVFV